MWRERDVFDNLKRGSEAKNAQLGSALELAIARRIAVITPEGVLSRFHTDQKGSISPTMLLATLPPAVALLLFTSIACGQTGATVGNTPTPTEIARIQTPTPELTSSPAPEKKAENPIPEWARYGVFFGEVEVIDKKTGVTKLAEMVVALIPPGPQHPMDEIFGYWITVPDAAGNRTHKVTLGTPS